MPECAKHRIEKVRGKGGKLRCRKCDVEATQRAKNRNAAKCLDCGAKVSGDGRRCHTCARQYTRTLGRLAPPVDVAPVDPTKELVYAEVAAKLVGRDQRIFRVLCEELGIETVKKASNDFYRLSDLLRIREVLKERATEWCAGKRSRPY
jgi:hypothetical protein